MGDEYSALGLSPSPASRRRRPLVVVEPRSSCRLRGAASAAAGDRQRAHLLDADDPMAHGPPAPDVVRYAEGPPAERVRLFHRRAVRALPRAIAKVVGNFVHQDHGHVQGARSPSPPPGCPWQRCGRAAAGPCTRRRAVDDTTKRPAPREPLGVVVQRQGHLLRVEEVGDDGRPAASSSSRERHGDVADVVGRVRRARPRRRQVDHGLPLSSQQGARRERRAEPPLPEPAGPRRAGTRRRARHLKPHPQPRLLRRLNSRAAPPPWPAARSWRRLASRPPPPRPDSPRPVLSPCPRLHSPAAAHLQIWRGPRRFVRRSRTVRQ